MFQLLFAALRRFPSYDRAVQLTLIAACVLLLAALVAAFAVPDLRVPALIAAGGLVVIIQTALLWANRDWVTVYTQAQRLYLSGDLDEAAALLERVRASGSASVRDLTLLGNTLRQQGRLDDSRTVLLEALDKAPDDYFALLGFGRTLLASGAYAEAYTALAQHALPLAPASARAVNAVDAAEAAWRTGRHDEARRLLDGAGVVSGDAARALMMRYIYRRLAVAPAVVVTGDPAFHTAALAYWHAAAERFALTPYGAALADDLVLMHTLEAQEDESS